MSPQRTPQRGGLSCLFLHTAILLSICATCPQLARGIRQVRDRVKLPSATGESNPRVDSMEFDPLVAEVEQEEDDRMWMENYKKTREAWTHPQDLTEEATGDWEAEVIGEIGDMGDMGDIVYSDEDDEMGTADLDLEDFEQEDPRGRDLLQSEKFNVSARIIALFPLIDTSPEDGRVSFDEMVAWHVKQGERASMHRTQREMEGCDADADGQATLQEALVAMGVAGEPSDEDVQGQKQLYTERFHIADLNNDQHLNISEFNDFLHPEESDNDELHLSIAKDEMKHRDMDGDMKLNLDEWELTTHKEVEHLLAEYDDPTDAMRQPFEEDPEKARKEKQERAHGDFKSFDKDSDGLLDVSEFRAVSDILWPSQKIFALFHTKDLIKQADYSKDGALTVEEMLSRPHAFYHTVQDHGGQPMHDEF